MLGSMIALGIFIVTGIGMYASRKGVYEPEPKQLPDTTEEQAGESKLLRFRKGVKDLTRDLERRVY
jgi:hypothetical protein